ncbi:MAG: electron transfer flavoprotein subunit alpha/FixB family protein [Bacteroidota bacterium]
MKILVFTEQREGKFKRTAYEAISAGKKLATELNAELIALAIGNNLDAQVNEFGAYGISRVIVVADARLQMYSTTAYAKIIAEVAEKENAQIIFLSASQMGKDLAPRIAVKLDAGCASDCIALSVENGDIVATRPVYAGKATINVKINSAIKIFTLRPNVFTAKTTDAVTPTIEKFPVALTDADFASKVIHISVATGRPDVTEATIVISGGRGMKAPENFQLIEALADTLGAGVGASRAVVDAGWRSHDEQVGQTGKTVSPSVYIACGISGAVQHLAGMSGSKCIVAINKDKDAPIFQIADYGIVGDALTVLPAMVVEVKKLLGK